MNELRTLIDISAGTRLPQYEPEIFSGKKLTKYYLRKLCDQYWWYSRKDMVPYMAYYYACNVMNSRWPEAEAVIATAPQWAMWYAETVVKSRWPEAEAIIVSDPEWAYYYAVGVMNSRWPEAEPAIATSPYWAYYYARDLVGSRWPEAEAIIATDRITSGWYNDKFGTNI